jgi:O-antigen ligase
MSVARVDEVPRPQLAEAGLFLLLVAAPIAFAPFTASPFADVKLPLVVGGTALLWFAGVAVDRLVAVLGAAWVALACISALTGVDPMRSLTAQTELQGSGVIVILSSAVLVAVSGGLTERLRQRAIAFSIAAGLVVAATGIAYRLFPTVTESWLPGQGLRGSTMGNPLFAATIVAVAVACVVAEDKRPLRRQLPALIVLVAASASFGERLTLALPLIAVVIAAWQAGRRRYEIVVLSAVTIAVLLSWLAIEPLLPRGGGEGSRTQLTGIAATDTGRFAAWEGSVAGWLERPFLGWGSGNTKSAYIRGSTPESLSEAGRGWADAHDIALESLVTTGPLATLAMLAILTTCAVRGLRRRPRMAWAVAAAAAIGAFSLIQPASVVLAPLLFFHAGAAGASRSVHVAPVLRLAVGVVLVAALATSSFMLAASAFERWGHRYGEVWALETALGLQPWRISAQRELALRLSVDAAAGDVNAATRAREVIDDAVDGHPWSPDVRLWAAQVEHLMGNDDATLAWIEEHVDRFPADRQILEDVRRNLDQPGFSLPDGMGTATTSQP